MGLPEYKEKVVNADWEKSRLVFQLHLSFGQIVTKGSSANLFKVGFCGAGCGEILRLMSTMKLSLIQESDTEN